MHFFVDSYLKKCSFRRWRTTSKMVGVVYLSTLDDNQLFTPQIREPLTTTHRRRFSFARSSSVVELPAHNGMVVGSTPASATNTGVAQW